MKRLLSVLTLCALLLSLAACGAKKDALTALTAPPELTVTNAQDASITAASGSYDWSYDLGNGERSGAIACGAHPLDESCRDITPVLEMPVLLSATFHYVVTLDFGGCAPDSVSLRYWSATCWGDTEAQAETLSAERQDDGTYTAECFPSIGVFAVDASWDADDYQGAATYAFRTEAAEIGAEG